jgi:hypothetical protein
MWWVRALRHRESEICHIPFLRGCPWFIVHQFQLLMAVGECQYAWATSMEADHSMTGTIAHVHHTL